LGDLGKKVHSGRSRNDQVCSTSNSLSAKNERDGTLGEPTVYSTTSTERKIQAVLLPGYTHLQIAMPSSFGLWFGAYAESLTDDMEMLLPHGTFPTKTRLGAAAGYGSSFPLDRKHTTQLLGFRDELQRGVCPNGPWQNRT
jgi:argininosuccinate lyase